MLRCQRLDLLKVLKDYRNIPVCPSCKLCGCSRVMRQIACLQHKQSRRRHVWHNYGTAWRTITWPLRRLLNVRFRDLGENIWEEVLYCCEENIVFSLWSLLVWEYLINDELIEKIKLYPSCCQSKYYDDCYYESLRETQKGSLWQAFHFYVNCQWGNIALFWKEIPGT